MAVSFDTKFYKGVAQSAPFSYVSNAGTVAGTVGANSNRVLIGFFRMYGSNAATVGTVSMTWNAVAMTAITSLVDMPAGPGCCQLFGLIAPATGDQTIAVSWTGAGVTGDTDLGAVSLFNCDQSSGWSNAGSDTGTGTSAASAVATTSGDMAVVGHQNNNASSTTINAGTSDWIDTASNGNGAQAHNAASGTSTNVSWTLGSSQAWANVKVSVLQVGGGDATLTPAQATAVLTGQGTSLGFAINMPDQL